MPPTSPFKSMRFARLNSVVRYKMKHLPSLAVVALALSVSAIGGEAPHEFPNFQRENATPLLIVGTVRPGKYLPQFGECADPDTVCMDPPPFWYEVEVSAFVHGAGVSKPIAVATTSHYGMSEFEHYARTPFLISLLTDGTNFVMPRYAMAGLVADSSGELHLLVLRTQPLHWLPCSAWDLREEIPTEDFSEDLVIPAEDAQRYVEDNPDLFREVQNGWVPRYSIRLMSLSTHLSLLAPTSAQMRCEQKSAG